MPPAFRFADRFTVVAGINGRGKTALLDGLALLASQLSSARVTRAQRLSHDQRPLKCTWMPPTAELDNEGHLRWAFRLSTS